MNKVQNFAVDLILRYLESDPLKKLPAVLALADKIDVGHMHAFKIQKMREILLDEKSVWRDFIDNIVKNTDKQVIRKVIDNLFIKGVLEGEPRAREVESKYNCNIPWAILMDPTSACNLSCIGCWAAHYGNKNNLDWDTMNSICRQGKDLGCHFYVFSGGEPLVRKKDLIRLCAANPDCYFFSFTNGTLVDDEFCQDLLKVGNLSLAFSIEGDEASTDMRRGSGTYRKVINAMDLMQRYRLLFGYSTCYHRYNTDSVGSDEFVDDMIAKGCRFAWNFTYIPVGKDARPDLIATPEQRAFMYRRVREIRQTKPIFAMDFWNDGEYIHGCIAGGRRYLHINAAGDVEPCAFVHYSNLNIHNVTLLEALQSPLFWAYRQGQPFNQNHLRPCPLLDNPQALVGMVRSSGAVSTDMESPEEVTDLCAKTAPAAEKWAATADALWEERLREKNSVPSVSGRQS
jgi:MoaA/NifB/PqqE/SkfB family radical SAM enzyme